MYMRKPESIVELRKCVDMYLAQNDETFLPTDKRASYVNIEKHWRTGQFIRVMEDEDEIVGWLVCDVSVSKFAHYRTINQQFYTSIFKGISAAKAVLCAHGEMIKFAEENRIPYCITQGSHMDPTRVMVRILEKRGWQSRGHIAVWRTSHASR
jgi:hypothetical protein